jgi:hypothetical protein
MAKNWRARQDPSLGPELRGSVSGNSAVPEDAKVHCRDALKSRRLDERALTTAIYFLKAPH